MRFIQDQGLTIRNARARKRVSLPGISLGSNLLLVLLASVLALTAGFATETPAARPVFRDGQAQIVPAFEDPAQWIRQSLWVETTFDSDGDGKRDRVFVDVTRPRQTETEGLKVPIIFTTVCDDAYISFEAMKGGACDYVVKTFHYYKTLKDRILENLDMCKTT